MGPTSCHRAERPSCLAARSSAVAALTSLAPLVAQGLHSSYRSCARSLTIDTEPAIWSVGFLLHPTRNREDAMARPGETSGGSWREHGGSCGGPGARRLLRRGQRGGARRAPGDRTDAARSSPGPARAHPAPPWWSGARRAVPGPPRQPRRGEGPVPRGPHEFRFELGGHLFTPEDAQYEPTYQASRGLLEGRVLERVRACPGVELREGYDVLGLVATGSRVTGVVVRRRGQTPRTRC